MGGGWCGPSLGVVGDEIGRGGEVCLDLFLERCRELLV